MRHVFRDSTGRLRNGWWALTFVAVLVPLMVGQYWLIKLLVQAGVPRGPWRAAVGALAVLLCTWACTRLRREPLASVGLDLDRRWAGQLGLGVVLGVAQMLVAVSLIWATGGVSLVFDPAWTLKAFGAGTLVFVFVAFMEELLFRGFLFQRLRDGVGTWPAQLLLAALFAFAHWGNPGMEGATRVLATIDTAIGALALGVAFLRTGSLALPVGMHFGWNWMQGSILGFEVSGGASAGLLRPTLLGQPEWLTGGAYGVEASVFALVVDVLTLAALLGWRRSAVVRRSDGASGVMVAEPLAGHW